MFESIKFAARYMLAVVWMILILAFEPDALRDPWDNDDAI